MWTWARARGRRGRKRVVAGKCMFAIDCGVGVAKARECWFAIFKMAELMSRSNGLWSTVVSVGTVPRNIVRCCVKVGRGQSDLMCAKKC